MIISAGLKSGSQEKLVAMLGKYRALGRKQKMAVASAALLLLFFCLYRPGGAQLASTENVNQVLSSEKADLGSGAQSAAEDSFAARLSYILGSWQVPFAAEATEVFEKKSRTIQVPGDVDSIQKAIDAAAAGDVVRVSAGEYRGTVVMKDGVSVVGESAETTILDGDKRGNVVTFKDIADKSTRLENFTIKNAKEDLSGILIENSSPLVNRNWVLQNDYDVYIKGESSPTIQRNRLSESKAGVQIFNLAPVAASHPIISDNVIFGNKKGINLYKGQATIEHNTISFNGAYGVDAGATFGIYLASASAVVRSNIVTDNGICEICSGIYVDAESKDVTLSFNDLWNNQSNFVCFGGCLMEENNLSSDPLFENGLLFNFRLKAESPLLTAGADGQKLGARI